MKEKELKWFLDFINEDLGSLPIADRMKLTVEVASQIHPHDFQDSFDPDNIRGEIIEKIGPNLLKNLNLSSFQDKLRNFFDYMMPQIKKSLSYQNETDWKSGEEIDFYPSLGSFSSEITIRLEARGLSCEMKEDQDTRLYRHKPESLEKASIALLFEAKSNEDILLFNFIRALEGIPLTAIRQCRECGLWFLHISKHKRDFCSNRCAARKGSRERRKKQKNESPKKYDHELKEGAKRARNSYEKKVKKTHPHAKIKERPTKHKAE